MAPVGGILGEGELPLNKTLLSACSRPNFLRMAKPIQLHPPQQLLFETAITDPPRGRVVQCLASNSTMSLPQKG